MYPYKQLLGYLWRDVCKEGATDASMTRTALGFLYVIGKGQGEVEGTLNHREDASLFLTDGLTDLKEMALGSMRENLLVTCNVKGAIP